MTFQLNKIKRIELIAVALLLPFLAMASSTAGSVDLGGLLGFMKDLNTSQTGEIITYIGFFGGLVTLLFSQAKLWGVMAMAGIPLIINYAPAALIALSGAGAVIH
ncbi:MAG: hypothetical protein O2809_00640 [Proteobacteria bacterium]|nr:hypothetical protein [Pseudomonadota bacterium]